MLVWQRSSAYSIRAIAGDGTMLPYHVSRCACGSGQRFTAWYGPLLTETDKGYFPECLGIVPTAEEARAVCSQHAEDQLACGASIPSSLK